MSSPFIARNHRGVILSREGDAVVAGRNQRGLLARAALPPRSSIREHFA